MPDPCKTFLQHPCITFFTLAQHSWAGISNSLPDDMGRCYLHVLEVGSVELVSFAQNHEAALDVLAGDEGDPRLRGGRAARHAEATATRQVVEERACLAQSTHAGHGRAQTVHLAVRL